MDTPNKTVENNDEIEEYIKSKYFPPIYEATEESFTILKKDNMKKIQLDPQKEDNIFIIENVLNDDEVNFLIERGERLGYEQSTVYSVEEDNNIVRKDIRDNHRVLEIFEALSTSVWDIVKDFFPDEIDGMKKKGLYKLWRYYRYHPGQNFAPHQDHVVYDDSLDGTESRYTFIFYLNDVEEGGETNFPNIPYAVKPKKGNVLAFRHENWHEGKAVKQGVKYLLRCDVMYKSQ